MNRSVLFYVQHLLGIGHLQRSLCIAAALCRRGLAVTLVSGGLPTRLPVDPMIRFVQLPPVHARDARFVLLDSTGLPLDDDLRQRRRAALLDLYATMRPDVVILESFPFGRRAFRFELEPLIAAVRASTLRPPLVCSVRDIIVMRDDEQRRRDVVTRIRHDFTAVLVHGDPTFIPFDASFPAAPDIADRLVYTGYVAADGETANRERAEVRARGLVLVSAGGGAAGKTLLTTALAARRGGCLAALPWLLLTGTNLPDEDFRALLDAAPPGVSVERFRHDLPALLRQCRLSVSQAGYNTVLDILRAGARAVLVPYEAERETEQLARAERLAALGAAELLRESELSTARLAAAMTAAISHAPARLHIETDGAEHCADFVAALISRHFPNRGSCAVQ